MMQAPSEFFIMLAVVVFAQLIVLVGRGPQIILQMQKAAAVLPIFVTLVAVLGTQTVWADHGKQAKAAPAAQRKHL